MLGNFKYHNPTKLYFGENSLMFLNEELSNYGPNIVLIYGGGSIKKSGLYDEIIKILTSNKKNIIEISGVMPNPTIEKVYEGLNICRKNKVDLLLAVGGGSVIDYAKALAVSINCKEDPWEHYFIQFKEPTCKIVPVGCVLTMVGTGSEMNTGSVITNKKQKLKIGHVFNSEEVFPKFAILNPLYTYSLPHYQMVAGIYDAFNHICEQYFSNTDDNTSDYLSEGLMKSLINASLKAIKNPYDYEARSNIMWSATWALNTLIAKGKDTDWMIHMLGQAIGALTNATHGMTLSCITLPYYHYIKNDGLDKFVRFAINVFDVNPLNKSKEEIANEGLVKLEEWMKQLGLVLDIKQLGIKEEDINDLVNATIILNGGYKKLTKDDVQNIFKIAIKGE